MPVKLSGELVEEARHSASLLHRSLTAQIEHWAAIGRAIESQLPGDALNRLLAQLGGTMKISRVAAADQRQQIAVQQLALLDRAQTPIFLLAAALLQVDDLQRPLKTVLGLSQPDHAHRPPPQLFDERIAGDRLISFAVFQRRHGQRLQQ